MYKIYFSIEEKQSRESVTSQSYNVTELECLSPNRSLITGTHK